MSVKDTIKKSVLESGTFAQYDMLKIMLAMTIALLMGCLIYMVYKKFYSGVVFSRSFAVTLVGMCVLTCMVTLAISTNIVISLGLGSSDHYDSDAHIVLSLSGKRKSIYCSDPLSG
mgnify:CR=1 FL=1